MTCHTPPLYTNNKLTLAQGYTPPADHPNRADIMAVSVGTDPNLALKTRKGTGFYKVPSLKGVWYRGMFSHDGSVTTLEEWFDPRVSVTTSCRPGFVGHKVARRAVATRVWLAAQRETRPRSLCSSERCKGVVCPATSRDRLLQPNSLPECDFSDASYTGKWLHMIAAHCRV